MALWLWPSLSELKKNVRVCPSPVIAHCMIRFDSNREELRETIETLITVNFGLQQGG